MSEHNNSIQNQEINLFELFQRLGNAINRLIRNLIKGILFLFLFGIQKLHFICLFIVAGSLIGLFLFSNSKRYYSSYMVAQANGISSADMLNYINDLNSLCRKGNIPALALALEMPDSTAQRIKDIQAFFIIDVNKDETGDYVDFKNQFNPRDTTMVRLENRIHVSVEVFDNQAFEYVKKGLFQYMSNNPYLIKLNEIRKAELEELIIEVDKEYWKIDSLQNTDYFSSNRKAAANSQSQFMILAEKEPALYYLDKLGLINRKLNYRKELELSSDAFTIIKDFTSLALAENPRGEYLMKYGLFFGILGYLLLLVIHFRKQIIAFMSDEKVPRA